MKPSQQRRVVVIVACLALSAALLVVFASRDRIARYYHLLRLRQDPSRLEAKLLGEANEHAAARLFVQEPEGQQALFRLYLKEFERGQPDFKHQEYMLRMSGGNTTHGSLSLWSRGYSHQSSKGRTGGGSFSVGNVPDNAERRELILELLGACVGPVFRVEELSHLEFQIRPVINGKVEAPVWQGAPVPPVRPTPVVRAGVRHLCYYRVLNARS